MRRASGDERNGQSRVTPQAARRIWKLGEPYHACVYFAPETREIYGAAGLKGGWMGYFASRSAAMGPVSSEVVISTFYNFHPDMVRRAIPDAWSFSSVEAVLEARLAVADGALRRMLGETVDSDHVKQADALLWEAVEAAEPDGRPLFAAHAALARPEPVHLSLWHAITCMREHRGDGHVALLVAEGISGLEAHLQLVASGAIEGELLRQFRGWSEEEWAEAAAGLVARGLLEEDGSMTPEGAALRQSIEDRTDALAARPYDALGPDRVEELCGHLEALTRKLYESQGVPFPNPMGLTRAKFAR